MTAPKTDTPADAPYMHSPVGSFAPGTRVGLEVDGKVTVGTMDDNGQLIPDHDPVDHPSHYTEGWSNGAEVIDISENLNFNRGNAVKYIARAGKKDASKEVEDLSKAAWYLSREIARLKSLETIKPVDPIVDPAKWTIKRTKPDPMTPAKAVGTTINNSPTR